MTLGGYIESVAGRGLTDDIVSKLVSHHLLQCVVSIGAGSCQLLSNGGALRWCAVLNALLHNIGRKFMLGKGEELAHDKLNDPLAILRLAVLDDVLGDIVTVLVSNENLS